MEVPEGYSIRDAAPSDAEVIAGLVNEVTVAEAGAPWTDVEDTRNDLTSPRMEVVPDQVLLDASGAIVGYVRFGVWGDPLTDVHLLVFVRPALDGTGLNAWLLRLGEARAARLVVGDGQIPLRASRFAGNDAGARLLAALGYAYARTFYAMRIDFVAASPEVVVPDGIAIRTFERGRDEEPAYAALAEAFDDHWGGDFETYDQWLHEQIEGEDAGFDAGMWFLAVEGDEIVGVAACSDSTPHAPNTGIVGELGVRRPWRGRGVAFALLRTAFDEMRRRGIGGAQLAVDASSPTGATRLYERAGMRVLRSWELWEKELRAGVS